MARDPEGAADRLDELYGLTEDLEDEVLTDDARTVRWAGPAFVLSCLVLLPWTIYLAYSLPARQVSPHYDVAWVGFDVMLLAAQATTAYFALRRSRYLATAASTTATLLIVDAWFDVVTSPRRQFAQSLALAMLIELPVAGVCLWLSYHSDKLAERRVILRLSRGRGGSAAGGR